ncbi:phosphate ABC transporter permease PstA [Halomicroarcula sp. GCM10025817]|uniref:phosphate ABC transporter permease PstA n=1 Tax=Haloarcula TaxID=2237 RepID=UPI003204636C
MSDAYANENTLVSTESDVYDRGLDAVISLTVLGFALSMVALVDVVPLDASGSALGGFFLALLAVTVGGVGVAGLASWLNVVPVTSQRVRGIGLGLLVTSVGVTVLAYGLGVTLATLLGLVLVFEAAAVAAAGVVSRVGLVDTGPDMSAGLLAGGAFGVIGLAIGAALGGGLVGFQSLLWPVVSLATAGVLAVLAIVPREDLGSTLPAALVVGTLGVVIATSVLGPGWQWNPQTLSGGFTGGAVIPVFVLFSSVLAAWSAAKARAGFGAQGREYGAFLVINLNALLMLAVMATIVVFVTVKGIAYSVHGLSIGAVAAMVLLAPLFVGAVQFARSPAGPDEWHAGARQGLRVLPLAVVGAAGAFLVGVLALGEPVYYAFDYTVLENRVENQLRTAVAVTNETTVGSLLLVLAGFVLFVYFFRKYGTLRNVGTASDRLALVRQAVTMAVLAIAALTFVFLLVGPVPFGITPLWYAGLAVIDLGTVAALALAALPALGVLAGTREASLADSAQDSAPLFTLGVFGGLGLLTVTLFLQPVAQVAPSVGPVNLVTLVAMVATAAMLAAAALVAVAGRSADTRIQRRFLAEELRLALAGAAGFLTLVGLHVAVTGIPQFLLGLSVANAGTLSWPMVQQAYIPLGTAPGGIMPAIVGTVWLVVGATLFAVPLGLGAAVFLTEYAEQGRFTALVEVATNALWSTPSIVFGLFGAVFLIPRIGGDESLLAGMLVLGFMLLPLVLITSREAIKSVPDEYRDASAALGVSRWETIRSVVVPAAMPGVITGVILGVGRIAGETAPLILVLGSTLNATEAADVIGGFRFMAEPPFVANEALLSTSASLPTQVWAVIAAGVSGSPSMGWATAFILLMVVLTFYAVGIVARTYFRRKLNYE